MATTATGPTGCLPADGRLRDWMLDDLSLSDEQVFKLSVGQCPSGSPVLDFIRTNLPMLRRGTKEWGSRRILHQLAREAAGLDSAAAALAGASENDAILASISPIDRRSEGSPQIMVGEGLQAVLPIDPYRGLAVHSEGKVALWDLDRVKELAAWTLDPGAGVSVLEKSIQVRESDGMSRNYSSADGQVCPDYLQEPPGASIERSANGEIAVKDGFSGQEPLALTSDGPDLVSRRFELSSEQVLVLGWGAPHRRAAADADARQTSCLVPDRLEVSFRLENRNGDVEVQGTRIDDLASDGHRTFRCVQLWGREVIAAVGTGGVFVFDRHSGNVVQLHGAPITTEFFGVYHAAALCSLPRNCGKVRLSSRGEVLLFGDSGAVTHYEAYGFGRSTELRQPDEIVIDARFQDDGAIVLLGSSGTLTFFQSVGDTPVHFQLPGIPVSMTSGPHGELGIALDHGFLIVDPRQPRLARSGTQHSPKCYRPKYAMLLPTGSHLVTWIDPDSRERALRVYDLASGDLVQEFEFEAKPGSIFVNRKKNCLVAWNHATTSRLSVCVRWNFTTGEFQQTVAGSDPVLDESGGWEAVSGDELVNLPPGWSIGVSSAALVLNGPDGESIQWHDSAAAFPLFVGADGTVVVVRQAGGLTFLKLYRQSQRVAFDGRPVSDRPAPLIRVVQPLAEESLYAEPDHATGESASLLSVSRVCDALGRLLRSVVR